MEVLSPLLPWVETPHYYLLVQELKEYLWSNNSNKDNLKELFFRLNMVPLQLFTHIYATYSLICLLKGVLHVFIRLNRCFPSFFFIDLPILSEHMASSRS